MYPQWREYVAWEFASKCQWKADSDQGKFFGVTDLGLTWSLVRLLEAWS